MDNLDREAALASGFHPAEFELDATGTLPDGSGGQDFRYVEDGIGWIGIRVPAR